MQNLPLAAQVLSAEGSESHELFMPTVWFGILMFVLLMGLLLTTLAFTSRGKQLPATEHESH